jgi:hypothetical protein
MIPGFEKLVEDKIKKAQEKGVFKNLEGEGKPLPEEKVNVNPELKMAYKILKNAGCLPPEIELKKEITRTEELLRGLDDEREILKTRTKLNLLIKKYNILNNFSLENELNEKYFPQISKRLK